MGSYARLSLGKLELGATKDDIDPGLIWIFRPSDKCIERIDHRQRQQLARYVDEGYIDEYDENNPFTIVEYRCTAASARDRLDLKGFTYEVAEASFQKELETEVRRFEGYIRDRHLPQISHIYEEELRVLRSLTVESWLEALSRIREEQLTRGTLDRLPSDDYQMPLLRHMLMGSSDFFGFPGYDNRHVVRILLETASPQEYLTYDLSDLVAGGWIEEADELVAVSESIMNKDFMLSQRVIILTEGDTDREVLERSLRILYPHLAEYFHFFDFTGKKVGGGAGELANLVRAFAAADVRHRILALFDNDTAAKASLSNLDTNKLPDNIAVCNYPDIPLAEHYPTLGPSGMVRMDVNGLAGSIELYLGEDVLRDSEGVLSPVQWTSYEPKLCTYQGVILDKRKVLKRFEQKLALCESQPDQISKSDWEGMRAIIDKMRTAFHSIDAAEILSGTIYE